MPPYFSVIIPTYNRAHVLPRAIDSVLAQTCDNFELIVVDDGSSDETEVCIRSYTDERLRYIRHERNLGQNRALNSGLALAEGEFVSFLDSDDEWLPELLERVLEKFHSDSELGCVYTAYRIRDASGELSAPLGSNLEGYVYKEALKFGQISPPTALSVRRRCFELVGGFETEPAVCQDDLMCLKLAKAFKFGLVREALALMHYDGGERVSKDPLASARGHYHLYTTFNDDIVRHCGRSVLAEHYLRCGVLFLEASERMMALKTFCRSLRYSFSSRASLFVLLSLLPEAWQRKLRRARLVVLSRPVP